MRHLWAFPVFAREMVRDRLRSQESALARDHAFGFEFKVAFEVAVSSRSQA